DVRRSALRHENGSLTGLPFLLQKTSSQLASRPEGPCAIFAGRCARCGEICFAIRVPITAITRDYGDHGDLPCLRGRCSIFLTPTHNPSQHFTCPQDAKHAMLLLLGFYASRESASGGVNVHLQGFSIAEAFHPASLRTLPCDHTLILARRLRGARGPCLSNQGLPDQGSRH